MTSEERERAKKAREKRAKDYEAREKAKKLKQDTPEEIKAPVEKVKMGFMEQYEKPENFNKKKCSYWNTFMPDGEPEYQACMVFMNECEWVGCNHQKEYLQENKLPLIPIS